MKATEQTEFTVDYFIKKFEATKPEQWIKGQCNSNDGKCHCALGWCGMKHFSSKELKANKEAQALLILFGGDINAIDRLANYEELWGTVSNLNDGNPRKEGQDPRERILNKLYSLKNK